jgi:hypothetical protein
MLTNEQTAPESLQEPTSQVENQETTVTEDQTEVDENASTEEGQTPDETQTKVDQKDEGQQQHEEKRQPTRAEKRLHQLLDKGKQGGSFTDLLNAMPEPQPDENGFFTPDQVKQMAAVEAARAIQLDREIQEYRQQTENFVSEIEEVGEQILEDFKDNPKLAESINKMLTDQLQAANLRTDEKGNRFLVPVQKPSQMYAQLKEALKLTAIQGTENANAELAKQIAEGAITPNAGQSNSGGSSLKTLQNNLWSNPGKVASELASRLPRSND